MPQRDAEFYRARFEAVLRRLVEQGWVSEFGFHESGAYGLKWTAKGRERAAWLRQIDAELKLGPEGLTALLGLAEK